MDRRGVLEDALADPRVRGDVFSYLAEQVFQRQSDAVQRFLLRTCCLEPRQRGPRGTLTGAAPPPPAPLPRAEPRIHVRRRPQGHVSLPQPPARLLASNGSCRRRANGPFGRCSSRRPRRSRPTAIGQAQSSLLVANELDLALEVIARGGEPSSSAVRQNNCGSGSVDSRRRRSVHGRWSSPRCLIRARAASQRRLPSCRPCGGTRARW